MGSHLTILLCAPRSRGLAERLMRQLDLIHLAARTPQEHRVLLHDENAAPVCLTPPPDLAVVLVSEGNVAAARTLAARLKDGRAPILLAGEGAESFAGEAEAVLVGEAGALWPAALADFQAGRMARRYVGAPATDWVGLPSRAEPLAA